MKLEFNLSSKRYFKKRKIGSPVNWWKLIDVYKREDIMYDTITIMSLKYVIFTLMFKIV